MPNSGQPTIRLGATGDTVRRLERALRRTPNLAVVVDGIFDPQVETAVKQFQGGVGLTVDGVVGPLTWAALPDGGPMPTLQLGSSGAVVASLFKASRSPGWDSVAGLLPPPCRRTRVLHITAPDRRSDRPRPMVLRAIPVACVTAAMPPRPAARASLAANRRRPLSSRIGSRAAKRALMAARSITL